MDRQTLRTETIGVLMGGASSEREISLASGRAVLESLLRMGFHAHAIDAKERLVEQLREKAVDVAFVALHGRWGEDGTVQGLLEMLGVPYTGSGVLGSAVAMDKCMVKSLHGESGCADPVHKGVSVGTMPLPHPVCGKTRPRGFDHRHLDRPRGIAGGARGIGGPPYDRKLLVEKYIHGPEMTVGVVNGIVLPIVEVRPKSGSTTYGKVYQGNDPVHCAGTSV